MERHGDMVPPILMSEIDESVAFIDNRHRPGIVEDDVIRAKWQSYVCIIVVWDSQTANTRFREILPPPRGRVKRFEMTEKDQVEGKSRSTENRQLEIAHA